MTQFKPLELEDMDIFSRYNNEYHFNTYEYSFVTLYLWRKMCKTEFAMIDDVLVIKKQNKNAGLYFMQPFGCKNQNLPNIVMKLNDIRKSNPEFKSLFGDIEIPFLKKLQDFFYTSIVIREDSDNFDYIYRSSDLISLSGKKYHRKKNQYNQFTNHYDYEIRMLSEDEEVLRDCMDFARAWYDNKEQKNELLRYELECVRDVLLNRQLLNIKGIAVYVDNQMAGFAFGEKINHNMGVIHIEKGDKNFSGIYPFLNKTLVERYFSDVEFVNMQEDLGIEGLRKAKMSYQPIHLEKKFIVDIL